MVHFIKKKKSLKPNILRPLIMLCIKILYYLAAESIVFLQRLEREFNAKVIMGKPKVSFRETLLEPYQ